MNYPNTDKIMRPRYVFSWDNKDTDTDKLRGLLRYTPLKKTNINEPKCLFVFAQKYRDHANKLYLSLRNGIASYPGCKRLTGISLERENVEAIHIPETGENYSKLVMDILEDKLSKISTKPDFAFILDSKSIEALSDDPYKGAKTVLTKYGIPSQYVSWELLDSDYTFKYAISNIALQFFVKLGGIPWSVSIERKTPTLVLGIKHKEIFDPKSETRRKFIGFAVCVLSNGLYLNTTFFPPSESYVEFLDNFEENLKVTVRNMLNEYKDVEKVTIHVSRFEKKELVSRVRSTIKKFETEFKLPIPFELVRLTDESDFTVFDLSHSGYVSQEGTVINLSPKHALLVTEGRQETAIWRGRKPITLEMHQEYTSLSSLKFRDSIDDAFRLSSVNWRGFNSITQPVSLQYADLLTEKVSEMTLFEPNICSFIESFSELNSVPWFI